MEATPDLALEKKRGLIIIDVGRSTVGVDELLLMQMGFCGSGKTPSDERKKISFEGFSSRTKWCGFQVEKKNATLFKLTLLGVSNIGTFFQDPW